MKNSRKIIEKFKKAFETGGTVNYKTRNGYIYYIGGILCILKGTDHFIAVGKKWIKI